MSGAWRCLAWLGAGVVLVAACAPAAPGPTTAPPKPTEAPKPAVKPAAQPTEKPAAKPAAEPTPRPPELKGDAARWEQVQQAAKKEGRVVVIGPGIPPLRSGIIDGFQKAYGLQVEYLALSAGEAVTRIDRESKAGSVTVDVYLGGTPSGWTQAERGQIEDIKPLLLDPAILDPKVWRDGGLRLTRSPANLPSDFHCCLQTAEWLMTDLFVNPQLIKAGTIKSWKDLLKPEFKGKIASNDVRAPGPGRTTGGYLWALFGEQYLRDLFKGQEVTLTADNRQLAEWVARGTYPIGLALVQSAVEQFRKEGLPLERVFPDDGPGILVGGFGGVRKIKGGPNPNTASVFINWFASREAQELWELAVLEPSLRTDVPHRVPEYVMPRPGMRYEFDDYDPDYYTRFGGPILQKMQEILGR